MRVLVCIDQQEWPGKEIPAISAQVENMLCGQENQFLGNREVQYQGNHFKIVQDTRYPQSDQRVIGIRCIS